MRFISAVLLFDLFAWAQPACPPTPAYSPCDLVFDAAEAEMAPHSNPYLSVTLHAEVRSPRHRTLLMPGFWDGGRRFVIRITPTDPGEWNFRVTSNIASINGITGRIQATSSDHSGFLQVDNKRAWSRTENREPHLWMGDTCYPFAWIPRPVFDQVIQVRAKQSFNHLRGLVMHSDPRWPKMFADAGHPNIEPFRELDSRILAMNKLGIFADLVLAADQNHLAEIFPAWQQRERYVRYLVARYAPMMITWQGVQEFEEYADGRAVLKEIGLLLKKFDPYNHPRSTHTVATSAPLLGDGWMTHVIYQSSSTALAAVERQLYFVPMINAEFAYEDSGAGKSHPHHVDSTAFRRRLWDMTMNGQYPTFGNTGTYGGRKFDVDPKYLDSPGVKAMAAWNELFSNTRFWELEPYFEVDGGRSLALPGVEYIVYLEKPGTVEIVTEKKSYQVYWMRPSTGEFIQEKKAYKGERFSGQPPDNNSDWVLHLSRDGRKEGMRKSWKFESRPLLQQDVERNPKNLTFSIEAPADDVLPVAKPVPYRAKLTRETRASRAMQYVWTAEATADGQGYRVLATAAEGTFIVPEGLAKNYPAVVNLRVYGINGNGKIYAIDRVVKAQK